MKNNIRKVVLLLSTMIFFSVNIIITWAEINSENVQTNIENYFQQYDGNSYPNEANGGSGCGAFLRGIWKEAYGSSLSNTIPKKVYTSEIDDYLKDNAIYGDAIWWNGENASPHAMLIKEVSDSGVTTYESSGSGTGNIVSKKYRTYSDLHNEFKEGYVNFYHCKGYTLNGTIIDSNAPKSTIKVISKNSDGITKSNAVVYGEISYTGSKPSEFGLYLGTSTSNLKKVATDPQPDFDMNPFPIWFDINNETSLSSLEPGKKYYWRCYAIQEGKEVKGEIKNFKTQESTDKANVKTTKVDNITESNAIVYGEISYSGEKPSEFGIYFGKSQSKLKKVATDPGPNFDMNPFPIWFDLNDEANLILEPNTKYYWKCYVVQNGKEYKGSVKSFKTLKSGDSSIEGNGGGLSSGGNNFNGGGGGGRF